MFVSTLGCCLHSTKADCSNRFAFKVPSYLLEMMHLKMSCSKIMCRSAATNECFPASWYSQSGRGPKCQLLQSEWGELEACHNILSQWGVCWVPAATLVTEMTACFVSPHSPHTDSLKAWSQTNRCSSDARYLKFYLSLSLMHSLADTHACSMQYIQDVREKTHTVTKQTCWCSDQHSMIILSLSFHLNILIK